MRGTWRKIWVWNVWWTLRSLLWLASMLLNLAAFSFSLIRRYHVTSERPMERERARAGGNGRWLTAKPLTPHLFDFILFSPSISSRFPYYDYFLQIKLSAYISLFSRNDNTRTNCEQESYVRKSKINYQTTKCGWLLFSCAPHISVIPEFSILEITPAKQRISICNGQQKIFIGRFFSTCAEVIFGRTWD